MTPQQAWALAAQELREFRLRKLADVLGETPHALDAAWGEPEPDWSDGHLDKLTHFSMLSRYRPTVMKDGSWCGDMSMWAWKLYGADWLRYFGFDADVGVTAATLMGLTASEGSALFEVRVTPEAEAGLNPTAFCHVLTPAVAAQGLRDVADGVFPSYMAQLQHSCPEVPNWASLKFIRLDSKPFSEAGTDEIMPGAAMNSLSSGA